MNVYMFSYRYNQGNTGGSGGVCYKILEANKKYRIIKKLSCFFREDERKGLETNIEVKEKFSFLRKSGLFNRCLKQRQLSKAINWLKYIAENNVFTNSDCYIFHDFESAYAFIKTFPQYTNTLFVYHQQGSLYKEWSANFNISSTYYKRYLDKMLSLVINNIKEIAFPSEGARNTLMNSSPILNDAIRMKNYSILYNGVDIQENLNESKQMDKYLIKLKNCDAPKLVTVSTLNVAKAVERIPLYLQTVKNKFQNFIWVIIGNGVQKEKLKENIKKYNLTNNIIWIDYKISNAEVLSILKETDYYIMMHRWSIFDLATLEAMGTGNIPILSNIGGNPEVIIEENGYLVDESQKDSVAQYISETFDKKETLKELNKTIQRTLFTTKKMLEAYAKVINEKISA